MFPRGRLGTGPVPRADAGAAAMGLGWRCRGTAWTPLAAVRRRGCRPWAVREHSARTCGPDRRRDAVRYEGSLVLSEPDPTQRN